MNDKTDYRYWLNRCPFWVLPGIGAERHRRLMAEEFAAFHRGRTPAEKNKLHRRAEAKTEAFTTYLSNIGEMFDEDPVVSDTSMGPVLWAKEWHERIASIPYDLNENG